MEKVLKKVKKVGEKNVMAIMLKPKSIIAILLIISMQISLIAPFTQSSYAADSNEIEYVKFDANWNANGVDQKQIGDSNNIIYSGTNQRIYYNLKLTGVPTGFTNVKLSVIQNDGTLSADEIEFETDTNVTKEVIGSTLLFKDYMASGQDINLSINTRFKRDDSIYTKNLKLKLDYSYKIGGNSVDTSSTIVMQATITPAPLTTPLYACTEFKTYHDVQNDAPADYSAPGYVNSYYDFRVNTFTVQYYIDLETVNDVYDKFSLLLSRESNSNGTNVVLDNYNTTENMQIDTSDFVNIGFNSTITRNGDGSTLIELEKGTQGLEEYNNIGFNNFNQRLDINVTYKVLESEVITSTTTTIVDGKLSTYIEGFNKTVNLDGTTYTKDTVKQERGIQVIENVYSQANNLDGDYDVYYRGVEKDDVDLIKELEQNSFEMDFITEVQQCFNSEDMNDDCKVENYINGSKLTYINNQKETVDVQLNTNNITLKKISGDFTAETRFYEKGQNPAIAEPFYIGTGNSESEDLSGKGITEYFAIVEEVIYTRNDGRPENTAEWTSTWNVNISDLEIEQNCKNNIDSVTKYQDANYSTGSASCNNYATSYIKYEKENQLSYLELDIGEYDRAISFLNIGQIKTITLSMYKNEDVIKSKEKRVVNKNPKIFIKLDRPFEYLRAAVNINGGEGKLAIKNWKFETYNEEKYLVIDCEGIYDSAKTERIDINVTLQRKLVEPIIQRKAFEAFMITDNENYVSSRSNSNNFIYKEADNIVDPPVSEVIPTEVYNVKKYYNIQGSSIVKVESGKIDSIEIIKKTEIIPKLGDNGKWDPLGAGNPLIIDAGETITYFANIKNSSKDILKDIELITRLPKSGNKSIEDTTMGLKLEPGYYDKEGEEYINTQIPSEFELPEGTLEETDIKQVSLTNLENIKVNLIDIKTNTTEELEQEDYKLYYTNNVNANFDTQIGADPANNFVEVGVGTDLTNATTLKLVIINEEFTLTADQEIRLEYDMTMPNESGMASTVAAVKYKAKDGNYEFVQKDILEGTAAYVVKGITTATITKTFEGEGVLPENLEDKNGNSITSFNQIQLRLLKCKEGEPDDREPLILTGQSDAQGIFNLGANGKLVLMDVPAGIYEVEEITEFKDYKQKEGVTLITKEDGSSEYETLENVKKTSNVIINKTWENVNEQQGTVKFSLIGKDNGKTYEQSSDIATGKIEFVGIKYGEYTLTETGPLYGWQTEDVDVVIDSETETINVENKLAEGSIVFTKYVPDGDDVKGLSFKFSGNGYVAYTDINDDFYQFALNEIVKIDDGIIDVNGVETPFIPGTEITGLGVNANISVLIPEDYSTAKITVNNVKVGNYIVEEIDIPLYNGNVDKYSPQSVTADITAHKQQKEVSITNQRKKGRLQIEKSAYLLDEEGNKIEIGDKSRFKILVNGTSFYGTEYNNVIITLDKDGKGSTMLEIGEYTITEVPVDGYTTYYIDYANHKQTNPVEIEVQFNKTVTQKIENELTGKGYVKVVKTLSDIGNTEAEAEDVSMLGIKFRVVGKDAVGRDVNKEIPINKIEEIPENSGKYQAYGISESIYIDGDYEVQEIEETVPEYYESFETMEIDLKVAHSEENPLVINAENVKGKGNLEIVTQTIPVGGPLSGIKYNVTPVRVAPDGTYTTIGETQLIDGSDLEQNASFAELTNIWAGNYLVEHNTVPDGWEKDVPQLVEVPSYGTGYAVLEIMQHIEMLDTTVKVTKEILNENNEIASVQDIENAKLNPDESFEIKIADVNTNDEYYTFMSVNEPGVIKGITEGIYEIIENYKPKYTTQEYYLVTENNGEKEQTLIQPENGKYLFTLGTAVQNKNNVEIKIVNKINTKFKFGGQDIKDNYSKIVQEEIINHIATKAVVYIVDEEKNAISGVTFKLYDNAGREVVLETPDNTYVTNNRKLIIKGLPIGTYTLKCISVPSGYVKPKDKTITIYDEATRVSRIEIQTNIPRGGLVLGTQYENNEGALKFVPRSQYKILNKATGELVRFQKNSTGDYVKSNLEDATPLISLKSGTIEVSGLEVGNYEIGLVDITNGYGINTTEPTTVAIENGVIKNQMTRVNKNKIVQVLPTYNASMILDENGEVWVWGNNEYGEFGNGNSDSSDKTTVATKIQIPARIKQISGTCYSDLRMAIDAEGKLWCWGLELQTFLGDKYKTSYYCIPVCVSDIQGTVFNTQKQADPNFKIIQVQGYFQNSKSVIIALDNYGRVWEWKENSNPVCLSLVENTDLAEAYNENIKIKKIGENAVHYGAESYALIDDIGRIWVGGNNYNGQLGTGDNNNVELPKCISNDTTEPLYGIEIEKIYIGQYSVIALDNEGKVWTWGNNSVGQLGNGTKISTNIPICISNNTLNPLYGVKIIEVANGEEMSVAIDNEGEVWQWGTKEFGVEILIPECISDEQTDSLYSVIMTKISITNSVLALDNNGSIWGWSNKNLQSNNQECKLGYMSYYNMNHAIPRQIIVQYNKCLEYNVKFKKVVSMNYATLALDEYGQIWTWGDNSYNGLGIYYGKVVNATKLQILGNPNIIDIQTTNYGAILLDDTGRVWTWGSIDDALGTGDSERRYYPKEITDKFGTSRIISIDINYYTGIALDEDGKVWTWGSNQYGNLGNNSTDSSNIPICISSDITNPLHGVKIKKIAAGYDATYAIDENGKLWSWGYSDNIGVSSIDATLHLNQLEPLCITDIEDNALNEVKLIDVVTVSNTSGVLLLDNIGKVWTLGKWTNLGTKDTSGDLVCLNNEEENPLKTYADTQPEDYKIVDIIADNNSTYIIDSNGNTWIVTYDTIQLLGEQANLDNLAGKTLISGTNNAVVDNEGKIWTWGDRLGKLGTSETPICLNSSIFSSGWSVLNGQY